MPQNQFSPNPFWALTRTPFLVHCSMAPEKPIIKHQFSSDDLQVVTRSATMAEELVSNHYKLSASQWLNRKYDIKTQAELDPDELVDGPFAQVIRYKGQPQASTLNSATYDFYKICLQDHQILATLAESPELKLFPFTLYIITHELIHIVRFSRFLQNFAASEKERTQEEIHVHLRTLEILQNVAVADLTAVFTFYKAWHNQNEVFRTAPA